VSQLLRFFTLDPIPSPFAPGAGTPLPELVGRDEQGALSTTEIVLFVLNTRIFRISVWYYSY